jgi:tight adherence protein B
VRQRAHDRHRRDRQLPAALDRLATSLRSGASLTQALGEAGSALDPPLGPEIEGLARAAERGRPVREVLDEWAAAHDDPGTRLAATALVLATVVGSTPARAVDGVASTLRERLDLTAERRALAVQARSSALVLSIAPVGFAALLVVGDTAAARFLLRTPAGWACLCVGVALDAVGAWWMARLSRSAAW